jgi:hypothetical protein
MTAPPKPLPPPVIDDVINFVPKTKIVAHAVLANGDHAFVTDVGTVITITAEVWAAVLPLIKQYMWTWFDANKNDPAFKLLGFIPVDIGNLEGLWTAIFGPDPTVVPPAPTPTPAPAPAGS